MVFSYFERIEDFTIITDVLRSFRQGIMIDALCMHAYVSGRVVALLFFGEGSGDASG